MPAPRSLRSACLVALICAVLVLSPAVARADPIQLGLPGWVNGSWTGSLPTSLDLPPSDFSLPGLGTVEGPLGTGGVSLGLDACGACAPVTTCCSGRARPKFPWLVLVPLALIPLFFFGGGDGGGPSTHGGPGDHPTPSITPRATPTPTPEPGSFFLVVGTALAALVLLRRRRREGLGGGASTGLDTA